MTHIVINLERGPEDQPVGRLTTRAGQDVTFTGWLSLIRLLEDELRDAPRHLGAGPADDSP
jgi:hypothetical protein